MDIDLLNEFIILSKCLNYSKAADQLYISQSVLSRHIQGLENQLGVDLFTRNKHSVALTPIGQIFAEDVEKVVQQYAKAMKHVQMSKDGALGEIEITTSYTLSSLFVYDFLPEFNRKYPHIKTTMKIEEGGPQIKKDIEENKRDLSIMLDWTENSSPQLEHRTFFKNNFYVFVGEGHPLSNQKEVSIEELSGVPMVYLNMKENLCSIPFFEKLFAKYNSVYYPCIEASSTESLFLKVLTGEGVSILSEPVFRYTPSKIKIIRISNPDVYINTNLIWNKNSPNTSVPVFVEEFSRFIKVYNRSHGNGIDIH